MAAMFSRSRASLWLIALCSVAFACAAPRDSIREKLYETTRAYNRALRWGDFDRAAEHLPKPSVEAFMAQYESMGEEIVMLDYKVTRMNFDRGRGVAEVRIDFRWRGDRDIVVARTVVDEVWQFHLGRWVLVDERRVSGDLLPVFAESSDDNEGDHPYLPGLVGFRERHSIGDEDEATKPSSKRRRGRGRARADAAPGH